MSRLRQSPSPLLAPAFTRRKASSILVIGACIATCPSISAGILLPEGQDLDTYSSHLEQLSSQCQPYLSDTHSNYPSLSNIPSGSRNTVLKSYNLENTAIESSEPRK